jgi:hypothetical protein
MDHYELGVAELGVALAVAHLAELHRRADRRRLAKRHPRPDRGSARAPSARTFASHEMKDATELAVGVSSAGFEFDCGRRRYLLCIAGV